MAPAPVVAYPKRRAASASSRPLALSEARRNGNRTRADRVSELRCECSRRHCTSTLPASAEPHRGKADRFLVVPRHFGAGIVVRAADRFFVVELRGYAMRH